MSIMTLYLQDLAGWHIGFLSLFLLLSIGIIFVIVRERQKRKVILSQFNSALSEADFQQFSPPLISQLIAGKGAYTRHITAGLLHLVRQGIITLNKDETLDTYYFSAETSPKKARSEHEDYLVKWMLYEVGNDGIFYVDDLLHFTESKERREQFIHKLDEWEQMMRKDLVKQGLLKPFSTYKQVLFGFSLSMILFGSFIIIASPFISVLYLLVGGMTFIVMMSSSSITYEGLNVYKKWNLFKTQLKKTTEHDSKQVEWLTASSIFAIGFGLKESYLDKFPIREASQFSIRQDQFPLYFYIAPGTTAISFEGKKIVDDLDASLDQIVSPVAYASDAHDHISGNLLE